MAVTHYCLVTNLVDLLIDDSVTQSLLGFYYV